MDCKNLIIDFCSGIGIDTLGFTRCRVFEELRSYLEERKTKGLENEFEEKDVEKRVNPFLYMEEGKTIISIAFPYSYDLKKKSKDGFSIYTWGNDYHKVVSGYLERICNYINSLGGKAIYFVDSNFLPERYIAKISGVGFIGKNNMVITKKYGSYVFLGEIITDIYMEEDKVIENGCGDCNICLEKCPTKAVSNNGSCPNICLSYITQKKHIEDFWFSKLQGRIFGCDSCQRLCPHNERANTSSMVEFKPNDYMKNPDLEELVYIDNKNFKEKYKITSCGWRGKAILQRNALIWLMSKEVKNMDLRKINSPYVMAYYNRLLNYFKL